MVSALTWSVGKRVGSDGPAGSGVKAGVPMLAAAERDSKLARGREFRAAIRTGRYRGQTAGMAPGLVQANLVILPATHAAEFDEFCRLNARACPLLFRGQPGDPLLSPLGAGIDVRHDLPAYHLFRDGRFSAEVTDLAACWRDDLVAFLLGCSYTFEEALLAGGVRLLHIEAGEDVAVYRTRCPAVPAGCFHGELVVSMRPLAPGQLALAQAITAEFPMVHGAPVHIGDPAGLGITDLARPDWGPPPRIPEGWVPAFWACGVTPQTAMVAARLPFAITHRPSHLLVTDLFSDDLRGCREVWPHIGCA